MSWMETIISSRIVSCLLFAIYLKKLLLFRFVFNFVYFDLYRTMSGVSFSTLFFLVSPWADYLALYFKLYFVAQSIFGLLLLS